MILSRQREWIIKVTYAKCPQAQEGLEDYIHRRTGISRIVQVQACLSLLFILTNRYYEKEAVNLKETLTPTTNFQILPIKKDFEIVKYYPQAFFGFCSKYVSFGK